MKKIGLLLVSVLLIAVFAVVPVMAKGLHSPVQAQTPEEIGQIVVAVVLFGLTVYAVSLGSERTTEVVNVLLSLLAKIPILQWLPTTGIWAWIWSGLVAAAGIFGFGIDVFHNLPMFANLDPEMVKMLGVLIVWVLSNFIHNSKLGFKAAKLLK